MFQVFRELEGPAEVSRLSNLIANLEKERFKLIKYAHVCLENLGKCDELVNSYETAVTVRDILFNFFFVLQLSASSSVFCFCFFLSNTDVQGTF